VTSDGSASLPATWPSGSPNVPVPAKDCAGQWQTDDLAITADGRKLYFAAAHYTSAAAADTNQGWGIYCFDETTDTVTTIASGFEYMRGIDVNRDTSALVISAQRDYDAGLWLVDTANGGVRMMADDPLLVSPSFTSDGSTVVTFNSHDVKMIKVPSRSG
jgi:Tol biopolymer transport system component